AERLLEIEGRLIPTGLHVFGRTPGDVDRTDLLLTMASFDRPELGIRSLTDLICEDLGLPSYSSIIKESIASPLQLDNRTRVEDLARSCLKLFSKEPSETSTDLACDYLLKAGCTVDRLALARTFEFLRGILRQLEVNKEVDSLVSALRGDYVPPGPG